MTIPQTPQGFRYDEWCTGPDGMRFELFVPKGSHKTDIDAAKQWLRTEHDVVSIIVTRIPGLKRPTVVSVACPYCNTAVRSVVTPSDDKRDFYPNIDLPEHYCDAAERQGVLADNLTLTLHDAILASLENASQRGSRA